MKQSDLDKEDEGLPTEQPLKLQKLARAAHARITDSEKAKIREDREHMWDRVEKTLYRGDIYQDSPQARSHFKVGQSFYPKLQLMQMIIETALPKMVNQNYKPSVTVEGHQKTYLQPDDPNSQQMLKSIQENGLQGQNLQEIAQQMINPAIEYYREKELLTKDIQQLAKSMLTLGEGVIVDAYGGQPRSFCVSVRDAFCDEYACHQDDISWGAYRYSKTLEEIRKDYPEWGHLVKPGDDDSDRHGKGGYDNYRTRVNTDDRDILKSRVWCYTMWMRDETEEEVDSSPIQITDVSELNRYRMDKENEWKEEAVYESGGDTPDYWNLTTKVTRKKYPAGIRQIVFTEHITLDDGTKGKLPEGTEMPIQWVPYFEIEGSVHGKGLAEIALEPELALDQFLKAGLEDTSIGTSTIIKENAIQPGNTFRPETEPIGRGKTFYLRSSYKGPISDVMYTLNAGETAQSLIALTTQMREFVEWLTGQYDPRMAVQGMRDASGELIKDLKDGSNDRLSIPRDNIRRAVARLIKNWVHYLVNYETDTKSYKRETFVGGEQWVQFAPAILGKFDWNYDVQVGRGANLPDDPEEQAAYVEALIDRMTMKPKPIRDFEIDRYEIPFGDEIKKVLDQNDQAQQQAQQGAAQAIEADIAAENKKIAGKELADALSNIAADGEADPGNRGKAIGALAKMATTGQVPDVSWFSGEQPEPPQPAMQPPGQMPPGVN